MAEVLDPPLRKERHQPRSQYEILTERLQRLEADDRLMFQTGSSVLALNSGLCGLVANNYLRKALNITQARFAASMPMLVMPFFSTLMVYETAVSMPLMEGDLNCAICASVRGGLVGAVFGYLYPVFLAIPLNGGLAARYSTAPLPSKENLFRYWMAVSKPVYKKLRFAGVLQAALGTYLATKQHGIYIKMLKLPEPGTDPTELHD